MLQAFCSTVIALIIGISCAFFTANRNFIGKHLLLSLSAIPLCLPSLLLALGFVSFFGMSGTLNTLLKFLLGLDKSPVTFLYSFTGIVIAQGFYNFPLVMSSIHDAWGRIPPGESEAARLLGADELRIFRTVTIFQLLPAIISSFMLVFLYCFFSFLIILLFGGIGCTTLEVEIYKSARATLNFSETARLAISETLLACFFVFLHNLLEKKASSNRGISFYRHTGTAQIKAPAERFFAFIVFLLILLFFASPLASILYNAFSSAKNPLTIETIIHVLKMRTFLPSLRNTILVASATALFCVILAFFYASFVRTVDSEGRITILKLIPMIPMAISAVILGVIITMLVKRGNVFHLIAAQSFIAFPLAFRQIYASLSKISQETIDASRILSPKRRDLLFRIYLPSAWRGILSAAGFSFALSAGDTTLPLVLALPNFSTLSLFTYRLAGAYRFHEACAAGVTLGMICAIVFAAANRLKEK